MTKQKIKHVNAGFSLNSLLGDLDENRAATIDHDLMTNTLEEAGEITKNHKEKVQESTADLILRTSGTELLEEQEPEAGYYLLDLKSNEVFPIRKSMVTVGCSESCDLVVDNALAPHTISRKHAVIEIEEDAAYITDTSSNGIFFAVIENNEVIYKRLPKGQRIELKKGCIFKLAAKSFKFIAP